MKYRLVLAEDEPAAAENIYDLIRLYCPDFELAGTAENGKEALELVRRLCPDLLITDIKMPVMDGLELLKNLHAETPDIKAIILSGYEDFEYARTALRSGAADYLLKPISPSTLNATLGRIVPLIEDDRAQKRLNYIQELISGKSRSARGVDKLFPAPLYLAGLCRKNGLPGRFAGIKRVFPPAYRAKGDVVDFYGRDDMECIHIEPASAPRNAEAWEKAPWLNKDIPGYRTIVFKEKPFPIAELPQVTEELCAVLARSLVIGKSQGLALEGTARRAAGTPPPDWDDSSALKYYLKDKRSGKIKDLLREQLALWEKQELPQFVVEERTRSFLEQLRNAFPKDAPAEDERIEFLAGDAFYYATGYGDLEKNLLYIIGKLLPERETGINKIDTPEFFGLIEEYVKTKLAEPLSLQGSCIHFGISQTYMSKLFRKYTGLSFTDYLTRSRMEKAKHYLSGGALVKDAAALTGFNDQFYFSKVFKAFTGRSPSEFAAEGKPR